jgi:hypothetical protein
LLIKMLLYIGNITISLDLQEISKRMSHFYNKLEPSKDAQSVNVCGKQTELEGCETAEWVH